MQLPDADSLVNIAILLILVAVGWTILRAVLKLTARLFRIGCLVLLVAVGVIWVAGWLGA